MKKMITILTIASTVIFGSTAAHAVQQQVGASDVGIIFVYGSAVVVKITPSTSNSNNCTRNGGGNQDFIYLFIDTPAGRAMYASLLTAKAAGLQVSYGVENCQAWGATTIPLAYRVDVR